MKNSIKLRSLHVFDSICQFGSITKASQQINRSQPAMTQSLTKLLSLTRIWDLCLQLYII